MRPRLQFRQSLLCLISVSVVLSASQLPATIQLDLVFPRNNTAYKPMDPFPVVFALHNGSAAWSYIIHWDWGITTSPREDGVEWEVLALGGYSPGVPGEKKPTPPPDSYLITDPASNLVNITDQELILRYDFGIRYACNGTTDEVAPERVLDVYFDGFIYFNLDRENGLVPDVAAAGPCATPIGAIGIEKEVRSDMFEECPVLEPGPQPIQTCALLVNDTVASQVAAAMLREAACPDQSWSSVTGLVEKCEPQSSGHERKRMGGTLWTVALTFGFVAVFSSFV